MAPRTRSSSAKPAEAAVSKPTRTRRATSKQPASATACSSTTSNRVRKGSRAASATNAARTRRAASVVSVQSVVSQKATKKALKAPAAVIPGRSGYGDAHAKREYVSMLAHAEAVRDAGLVDEETAEKMCQPWQEKGVLEVKWGAEYLLPGVQEKEAIMDLKTAQAIARRKDVAEKKYLEDYFSGGKQAVEKKDRLKSVTSGRIQKKKSSSKPPASLPIIIEDDEDDSETPPDPAPVPAPTPPVIPVAQAPVMPFPGLPDYEAYGYYDLAAICYERNLVSGGKAPQLRARLIQDDINVIQDLPREAKPYSKEKQRERKHKAPAMAGAPQVPPATRIKTETCRA